MRALAGIAMATAMTALCAPAAAQDQTGDRNIIVDGETVPEPSEVRELVRELSQTQRADRPATRYFDALCLSVSGLNEAGNTWIRERIYANAAEVELDNSGEDCLANALVLIHPDPAALVEQIKKDVPHLLPPEQRDTVNRQLASGSQVIVWHNLRDYSQGGRPGVINSAIPGDNNVGGSMNVQSQININSWPSRTQLAYSRAVVSAAIILDADIVAGMEINRLADYATMRLMAPELLAPGEEATRPASITSPFPEETGIDMLTRFDRAYLSALYSMRPNDPAPRLLERVAAAYDGLE